MGPCRRCTARGQAPGRQRDRRRRRLTDTSPSSRSRRCARSARDRRGRHYVVPADLGPQRHARARLRGARAAALEELSGPGEAFEIADSIGRGHELDAVCRRAALRVAGELPKDALLFLNVSPQTLEHDALAGDSLLLAVRGSGFEPRQVVLEMTERTEPQGAPHPRGRAAPLGFLLAFDDVGAGNAGLEMLRALPVDFIKIDRAVVASAVRIAARGRCCSTIMAFARESGSFVIAEGSSTEAMLELARDPNPERRGARDRRRGRRFVF